MLFFVFAAQDDIEDQAHDDDHKAQDLGLLE